MPNNFGISNLAVHRQTLPSTCFKIVILTNILAFLTFWTTFYPPTILIIMFLATHFALMLLGPAFLLPKFLQSFGCFIALLISIFQWKAGLPLIIVMTTFTTGILIIQSIWTKDGNSAYRCLILGFMVVLASGAMNVNFIFPLAMFPYCIALLTALFQLAKHSQIAESQLTFGTTITPISWQFVVIGTIIMILSWSIMFFLFPRSEAFGLSSMVGQRRLVGFSHTLKLGEVGSLHEDPTVVMRVKPLVDEINPQILNQLRRTLLRGCSFVSYSKGNWNRRGMSVSPFHFRRNKGILRIRDFPNDTRKKIRLEILLENTDPPVMFIPDQAETIYSDLPSIIIEADGSITFTQRRNNMEIYYADVLLGKQELSDVSIQTELFIPPFLKPYLDVGDLSPTVQEFAQSLVPQNASMLQKVLIIQDYLMKNLRYSATEIPSGIKDPIAFFLFQSQSGTCEHFASTMALMLRSIGIPARPVNGYVMEEWNEYGEYFTIRQSHAHSWVEACLPKYGWVAFDPTPPVLEENLYWFEHLNFLKQIWYRFEAFWLEYVYSFNRQTQANAFEVLKLQIQLFIKKIKILILPFIAFIFLVRIIVRKNLFQTAVVYAETTNRRWIPDWYHQWTKSLPITRRPWETPREFHARLVKNGVIAPSGKEDLEILADAVDEFAFSRSRETATKKGINAIQSLKLKLMNF